MSDLAERFNWEQEYAVPYLRYLWGSGRLTAAEVTSLMTKSFGGTLTRNAVLGKIGRLGFKQNVSVLCPPGLPVLPFPHVEEDELPVRPALPAPATVAVFCDDPNRPPGGYRIENVPAFGCKFALTDHLTRDHRFCGLRVVTGKSWCKTHYDVVFPPSYNSEYQRSRKSAMPSPRQL